MSDVIEIFVFIDALGWDLVSHENFGADILPHRRPVEMQFGFSCTAVPTILTGKRPDAHGHLAFFSYAPERSPFKRLSRWSWLFRPRSFWDRGRVRGWLSKAIKRLYGFTGYFQLYRMPIDRLGVMDYCEKTDLFAPRGLAPLANLRDVLDASGVPFSISDWRIGDAANFAAAEKAVAEGARFLFVYTCELDAIRHDWPSDDPAEPVRRKLAWYRARLDALLAAARATGRPVRLTVFSDHGMTPLTRTVDLPAAVASSGLRFGVDYGVCFDSTMARFTWLKPDARAKVEAALAPLADSGRWLTVDEMRHWGVWREDRLFGDAIFLMEPGVQIAPSDMGLKPLNGMHGFRPDHANSLAAVLSTEAIPPDVRAVSDYFALMTDALAALAKT